MSVLPLSLANLKDLDDGKAAAAFDSHLRRIAQDCLDRPADATARGVTLEVVVKPILEDDGSCDRVDAQISVKSKIPQHKTRVYNFGLRRNGQFAFSEMSPDNFDQTSIFDGEE
jgi:hypothetical protein